jgi:hypothetical protein
MPGMAELMDGWRGREGIAVAMAGSAICSRRMDARMHGWGGNSCGLAYAQLVSNNGVRTAHMRSARLTVAAHIRRVGVGVCRERSGVTRRAAHCKPIRFDSEYIRDGAAWLPALA